MMVVPSTCTCISTCTTLGNWLSLIHCGKSKVSVKRNRWREEKLLRPPPTPPPYRRSSLYMPFHPSSPHPSFLSPSYPSLHHFYSFLPTPFHLILHVFPTPLTSLLPIPSHPTHSLPPPPLHAPLPLPFPFLP